MRIAILAMFLLILAIIFLAGAAIRSKIWTSSIILELGVVVLIFVMCLAAYIGLPVAKKAAEQAATVQVDAPGVSTKITSQGVSVSTSTDKLWDRLTAARIDLSHDTDDHTENDATEDKPVDPTEAPQPTPRPDWVDKAPKRVGDVYRTVVASDPFSTVDECFEQLEDRFPEEVEKRLKKLVPEAQQATVGANALDELGVSLDYIMREICREEYTETDTHSFGDMKQVHVLMEFTPAVEKQLLDSWTSLQRRDRVVGVAKVAGAVFACVAAIFGLLQVDTWTRGYYSKRLLVGGSAAIIAVAAALLVS